MKSENTLLTIIGGGPAGLSAAIYAARAGLKPMVFAGSPPGGQLTLTTEVENFPGHESILGPDLILTLRKQASTFGAELIDENITSVKLDKNLCIASSSKSFTTKALIIATGAKALWLGLESETRLRGKGVSACATCDGFFFRDKVVAVVGGGDTALEEAQTLTKFAKKVYLIHRRDSFRASKIMQERTFENKSIEVLWNTTIGEILGTNKVEGVNLVGTGDDASSRSLPLDGVFVAIGHKPDTELFRESISTDKKGYIYTSASFAFSQYTDTKDTSLSVDQFDFGYQTMTSVRGIFAAGDCVDHMYRQAGTAAGMGIAAALDAQRYLVEHTK